MFLPSKILLPLNLLFLILFVVSLVLHFYLLPNIINTIVDQSVRLENSTEQMDRFLEIPFPLQFKVYIFAIENVAQVLAGESVPKLKEIGPYVYNQYRIKHPKSTNSSAGTISYTQNQRYEFNSNASYPRKETDIVTVLNLPLLALLQETILYSPLVPCLDGIFGDKNHLFINVTIRELFFDGIDFCYTKSTGFFCLLIANTVCKLAATKLNVDPANGTDGRKFLKFSYFNYRAERDDGLYEVNSGLQNIDDLGYIETWNNGKFTKFWGRKNNTCDKVEGYDGSLFPPRLNAPITIYSTDICRKINLEKVGQVAVKNIEGDKYVIPKTAFWRNTTNVTDCYCTNLTRDVNDKENCYLDGTMDMSSCIGSPVLLSLPHFLWANESYSQSVISVHPNETLHEDYVVIEPNTGTVLEGFRRIQINAILRPIPEMEIYKNLPKSVVPTMWCEEGFTLPDNLIQQLNDRYFTVVYYVTIAKWVFMALTAMLTSMCSVWFLYKNYFQL